MASLLKKMRLEQNLTQAELAKRVGTSQAQIYRLENCERKLTVEWAERLAPALSVSAQHLLFGDRPNRLEPASSDVCIPVEANAIMAKCLALADAMERTSDQRPNYERRAAQLIAIYNTCLKTGRMPEDLFELHSASFSPPHLGNGAYDPQVRR